MLYTATLILGSQNLSAYRFTAQQGVCKRFANFRHLLNRDMEIIGRSFSVVTESTLL